MPQVTPLRRSLFVALIAAAIVATGIFGFLTIRAITTSEESPGGHPVPPTSQPIRPFDPTRIPPAMQLPHENDGEVLTTGTQWDLPSGCTDDKSLPGDDARLDTRDVRYASPDVDEHWQIAVYRDESSATTALTEMRSRETCTGAQGPPIDVTLGNQGFTRNYYEGGPEDTRSAHWVGARVGTAIVLLHRRLDPEPRRDLQIADQQTVQMAAEVITDLCGWGWRC